jgi:glycosyltransferase involved in cell wall biosynthesis
MLTDAPAVTVVIPCYNEEGALPTLYTRVREQFLLLGVTAELLFIDDGSTDGTRTILRELAANDPLCRVIAYRRNCGKSAALQTGFSEARGAYIITMDADLQDDPAELPRFMEALKDADLVAGWKVRRLDPIGKTLPSKLANWASRKVTGVNLHDMNCGFKGYRREVVQEITLYGELHRYIPALAAARGFRIVELGVTHHPRTTGVSKYGWERFLRGFLDLVTVAYLTKYRFRPLHFFGSIGLGLALVALLFGTVITITDLFIGRMPGWHFSVWMLSVAMLIIGVLLFPIGLIAEGLLASTFKQAPLPPIAERLNCDEAAHDR